MGWLLNLIVISSITAGCAGAASDSRTPSPSPKYSGPPPTILDLEGDITHVHDPAIIREGGTYYLFSTGLALTEVIPIRCSRDLRNWRRCGDVFPAIPQWASQDVPGVKNLWAPDISYFDGRYHLYYSASTFGSNHSSIGLATNKSLDPKSPEYQWVDQGKVIESRRFNDWNAIDSNVVIDDEGRPWLSFGSFWDGIKLRRLDHSTGKLSGADTKLYSIASRPRGPGSPGAVEAPFLIRRNGYYYLLVSFDSCCKGAQSTYKIMVGRSKQVTGPYLDRAGNPMWAGGGTLLIAGSGRWRGPGHNAVLLEQDGDKIIYHAYDTQRGGIPTLRIGSLVWDDHGWPLAANPNSAAISSIWFIARLNPEPRGPEQ